jgi:ElaB/YqjD/DUF883 family membrane-anchored ribosome-binding protein
MKFNLLNSLTKLSAKFFCNVKRSLSLAFTASLVTVLTFGLLLQFNLSGAIANSITDSITGQIDKVTQGMNTDKVIDKVAGGMKEVSRDLRDGRPDKLIDKAAGTAKDFTKNAGNQAKELAKNTEDATKNAGNKAKKLAKNTGNVVKEDVDNVRDTATKAKSSVGDRTGEALDQTKNLTKKADNSVGDMIDSVKGFLGQ